VVNQLSILTQNLVNPNANYSYQLLPILFTVSTEKTRENTEKANNPDSCTRINHDSFGDLKDILTNNKDGNK
jgi:hypothetical protein